ncbi:Bystin-domain-containing protein [Xylariales sp. AK1849]|nr:Bystin-domain-containing protein [Xylariales sp. AK1849]
MPKSSTPTAARPGRRHNPLEDDLLATGPFRAKAPKRKAKGQQDENEEQQFIDSKATKKILEMGRELDEESAVAPQRPPTESNAFGFESRFDQEDVEEPFGEDDAWGDDDEVVEEVEIEVADLETFTKFLPTQEDPLLKHGWDMGGGPTAGQESQTSGKNLADLILSKIAAHEAGAGNDGAGEAEKIDEDYELPDKVVDVYTKIGMILSRYKSGKLPKPFKILPTIRGWEQILEITQPDSWTPNAVYEATRIFVSSKPAVVQRFLEMVVLERVRDDIRDTKKLNTHLFNALKKALYKPASFFKGFLFPLVGSGSTTLREAHIISAVLVRISIPVLHSAAALKGLCDIAAEEASAGTEGGGATNVFIKALLEKRYALPFQVLDALVFHFLRFRSVDPASVTEGDAMDTSGERAATRAKLPVIWHQTFLVFAERYRNDITEDQREALLDLLLTHGHHTIGPEIRRELLAGRGRGVPLEPEGPTFDGDDTMMSG